MSSPVAAVIEPDDNRRRGTRRMLATCGLAALTACSTSMPTRSVASLAPPAPLRLPTTAATTAPAHGAGASSFADAPWRGGGRDASGGGSGNASDFDAFAPRERGGHLDFAIDPLFAAAAQEPQTQDTPQRPDDSRWSDFLPIGRAAVIAAGYELPRAFGFGVAYTRLKRDIEVDEVRVGIDGGPPRTVNFLAVQADSVVDNVMGRLDAWIFPFWNVSVLAGWTWNESASEVTVSVPFPNNPRDVTFAVPTRQDGPTWGVGTNLAAGYGQWFISGDATWIYADMQDFALIEGFLGSIRSGWNGKLDGKPARVWGGVTYWDTATTIEGDAATADGNVHFAVDQGPVTPYSLQIGGAIDLDPGYGVAIEAHLLRDVRMIVVSAALRF